MFLIFNQVSNRTVVKKRPLPNQSEESLKAKEESENKASEDSNEKEIIILQGTGRLTSSGTTVQGHYTEFMNQLSPGDAIIITHPTR